MKTIFVIYFFFNCFFFNFHSKCKFDWASFFTFMLKECNRFFLLKSIIAIRFLNTTINGVIWILLSSRWTLILSSRVSITSCIISISPLNIRSLNVRLTIIWVFILLQLLIQRTWFNLIRSNKFDISLFLRLVLI